MSKYEESTFVPKKKSITSQLKLLLRLPNEDIGESSHQEKPAINNNTRSLHEIVQQYIKINEGVRVILEWGTSWEVYVLNGKRNARALKTKH